MDVFEDFTREKSPLLLNARLISGDIYQSARAIKAEIRIFSPWSRSDALSFLILFAKEKWMFLEDFTSEKSPPLLNAQLISGDIYLSARAIRAEIRIFSPWIRSDALSFLILFAKENWMFLEDFTSEKSPLLLNAQLISGDIYLSARAKGWDTHL